MPATNRDGIQGAISRIGLADAPTAIDPTNGETWTNDGTQWLEIIAAAGGAVTASVAYVNQYDGQTVPPKTITVPASARRQWGPFPVDRFGPTPVVTWTGTTSGVTFNLRKLGN